MSKSARMGMAGVAGWSIAVAGALTVLSSCGKVADVLDAPPGDAVPSAGGASSRGAPDPPAIADASAGNTSTSAPAAPAGSGGTSGGLPVAPPSAGGSSPGASLADPHAAERRSMAEKYCAACNSDPNCVTKVITDTASSLPDSCWNQWVTSMNCSITSGCVPVSGGPIGMGACLAERNALDDCINGQNDNGIVMGISGSCDWYRPASGSQCQLSCADNLDRFYDALCNGPPNGPFACLCRLNGRNLYDSLVPNAPGFYGDTCEEAAQQMADGYCQKITSCCYAFRGPRLQGDADTDLCECTSDPSAGGFMSCADLAASKKDGKVVDLCPAYSYPS
jgi:hypothetical protein